MATTPAQSGELTLKQAGIMMIVAAAVVGGANYATKARWAVGGIPAEYFAAVFAALGLVLAVIGFAKKR
ncbi:MAG TPA: hypothetical protein VGM90_24085 [Kofleriaceae bacterium]